MNLPNLLTLSRVPILFLILALIYLKWSGTATLAFALFIVAGITDWLDGHYARKLNQVSNFGKLMDALTDKVLIVGMMVILLTTHLLPEWAVVLVLLILSREFLVTGLRLVAASNGKVLAAEKSGKQKTVLQIIAISTLLAVPVIRDDIMAWTPWKLEVLAEVAYIVGLSVFVLSALMTFYSGFSYLAKYWNILFEGDQ